MADALLAIDAGGTSLKYALMGEDCAPLEGCIPAQVSIEDGVLGAFQQVAKSAVARACALRRRISWVGICCPGPFDFAKGQSQMRHKWADAYEKPIAPVLLPIVGDAPIAFLHDSSAFMLGEGCLGAGRGTAAPCGVMLGTGLGFAYMHGGRVQVAPSQSPRFSLWNSPFQGGIAEEFVSRAAIRARYGALGGNSKKDVHEIADAAFGGETAAVETFAQTGALLCQILTPVTERLGADCLILGGQIARSGALLMAQMRLPIPVRIARHIEDAALRGIARYGMLGPAKTVEEGIK